MSTCFKPVAGLVSVGALLLSACATPPADHAPSDDRRVAATLLTVGDTVRVNGRAATRGQRIRSGDRVRTGTDSSALIKFSDQTTIQIIDAVDPVQLSWRSDRLTLRMNDAAVQADKGFFFRIIEAIGELAHLFTQSNFVVEEQRAQFFRIDLFSGRATLIEPRVDRELTPGEFALVTRSGRVEIGQTPPGRRQELESRFGRWDFSATRRVPDLLKLSYPDALERLERAGLHLGRISGDRAGERYVVGQEPPPGTRMPPGSSVDLEFKARQEIITVLVPDVRNLLLGEALARLKRAGLEGRVRGGQADDAASVVDQHPKPDARIKRGSPVDLQVRVSSQPEQPPSYAGATGVVVVRQNSSIRNRQHLDDPAMTKGLKLCMSGGPGSLQQRARRYGVNVVLVPLSELFQAMQVGVCDAALYLDQGNGRLRRISDRYVNQGYRVIPFSQLFGWSPLM